MLEGFITSAGAGSDSVLKSARSALLLFLSQAAPETQSDIATSIVAIFARVVSANDRVVVPLMEVVALLLDMSLFPLEMADKKRLFLLTQKSHFKSTNVAKLTAAIRVYSSFVLANVNESGEEAQLSKDVSAKLVGMLLHPFPGIRLSVSEVVYLIAVENGKEGVATNMEKQDWTKGTKELMSAVRKVKGGLV